MKLLSNGSIPSDSPWNPFYADPGFAAWGVMEDLLWDIELELWSLFELDPYEFSGVYAQVVAPGPRTWGPLFERTR